MTDHNPLPLFTQREYLKWREKKLVANEKISAQSIIEIRNPLKLSIAEITALTDRIKTVNFALYQFPSGRHSLQCAIKAFAQQLGLNRIISNPLANENGITSITTNPTAETPCAKQTTNAKKYIPYTNRALNWHTDGYYNRVEDYIGAFILHCVIPAAAGGSNTLMDPELAYIRVRDNNPDWIQALSHPTAMTIPANIVNGREQRPTISGPVYFTNNNSRSLAMRYTARSHSIVWRQDETTLTAIQYLRNLMSDDSKWVSKHCLNAGQGIICNNVLHKRDEFCDGDTVATRRLLYRVRYADRVLHT